MYLYLTLYIYSFFLFFLSFALNIFVSLIFIALFPNWHLDLDLASSLCFSKFYTGRYNFWFPLFSGSVYCTLFLWDCFDFDYEYICIYVYLVTLFYCCYKPLSLCWFLQFCGVFLFSLFFF